MTWETKTIPLICPIPHDDGEIKEITIRTPNGKRLRQIGALNMPNPGDTDQNGNPIQPSVDQVLNLISIIGEIPIDAVDEMHPDDIAAVSDGIGAFLDKGAAKT